MFIWRCFSMQYIIDLLECETTLTREDIIKNLQYSVSVLDNMFIEETR